MASTLTRQGLHVTGEDLAVVRRAALSAVDGQDPLPQLRGGLRVRQARRRTGPRPVRGDHAGHQCACGAGGPVLAAARQADPPAGRQHSDLPWWRSGATATCPALSDPVTRQLFLADVIGKYQGIFDIEDPREVDVVATEWPLRGI